MTQEEFKEELSDVLLNLGGLSFSDIYSLLEEDSAISFEGEDLIKIACHFAEWQKQKDLEDLFKSDMTMPNKFYEKGKDDAMNEMKEALQTEYEKGRFDMREEMMKDAIDAIFIQDYAYKTPILYGNLKDKMNIVSGQSIKLCQIKEVQQ